MSGLLVLGSGEQAHEWSRLLAGRLGCSADGSASDLPDALVVLNDRSASAVDQLKLALQLRREQPDLPVAVLTLVEDGNATAPMLARALSSEGVGGAVSIPPAQAAALIRSANPQVQVSFDCDVLSFEYSDEADGEAEEFDERFFNLSGS